MLMCRDLANIASDYIDGELGAVDNFSIKMHMLMCRDCRTFIGNLRESIHLLQMHSSFTLDEDYARRIDEQVAEALKKH